MDASFPIAPAPPRALWLLVVLGAVLLGTLLLFAYVAYSARHTRYEVSPAGLSIRGTLYGRTLAWDDLQVDEARVVDLADTPDLRPGVRTNGIGLPGYQAGWFRLRRAGRGLLFLTDRTEVLVLPTNRGYTLLLSARDPAELLEALRRQGEGRPGARR